MAGRRVRLRKESYMFWFILFVFLLMVSPPAALIVLVIGVAWSVFVKKK